MTLAAALGKKGSSPEGGDLKVRGSWRRKRYLPCVSALEGGGALTHPSEGKAAISRACEEGRYVGQGKWSGGHAYILGVFIFISEGQRREKQGEGICLDHGRRKRNSSLTRDAFGPRMARVNPGTRRIPFDCTWEEGKKESILLLREEEKSLLFKIHAGDDVDGKKESGRPGEKSGGHVLCTKRVCMFCDVVQGAARRGSVSSEEGEKKGTTTHSKEIGSPGEGGTFLASTCTRGSLFFLKT